jgi:hypothetical protein
MPHRNAACRHLMVLRIGPDEAPAADAVSSCRVCQLRHSGIASREKICTLGTRLDSPHPHGEARPVAVRSGSVPWIPSSGLIRSIANLQRNVHRSAFVTSLAISHREQRSLSQEYTRNGHSRRMYISSLYAPGRNRCYIHGRAARPTRAFQRIRTSHGKSSGARRPRCGARALR